jgi:hypothetical protein
MSNPTPQQKIAFALSMYSNLVSGPNPPPNPDVVLSQRINAKLTEYQTQLGKWKVVWGPIAVTYDTFYFPINAMYLAQSLDDTSQYVLAVAGTNPVSVFDWLIEDALVSYQLKWPFDLSGDSKFALGTAIGLTILLSNAPSSTLPGAGKTIREFLAGLSDKKINLLVNGHSLGGALSPTLALWLKNTQILWDTFFHAKISSLPTAGPTPGNGAFATYLTEKVPVERMWNTYDIVPHAWEESLLSELPTLYAPAIPNDAAITFLVDVAKYIARDGDYTQSEPDSTFEYGVYKPIINPNDPNVLNYLIQAGYQHTTVYNTYFDVPGAATDSAIAELKPSPRLHASVLARAAARSGKALPAELSSITAGAEEAAEPITVPVKGVPTPLPARADDPATAAIAAAVQDELKKLAE